VWPVVCGPLFVRQYRGRVGPRKPVYFFHIRKTAGTSLAKSFESLGGEDPNQVERRMSRHAFAARSGDYLFVHKGDSLMLRMSPFTFAWSHAPFWSLRVPRDTLTVTILRDPLQRVLSHYSYLADETADAGHRFKASPYARSLVGGGLDDFIRRARLSLLVNQLYTFSEQLDPSEAAERIRGLSLYFFSESFDEGVKALSTRASLPLPVRRERVSSVSVAGPDRDSIVRLRRILEPEYTMLSLLRKDPGAGFVGTFPGSGCQSEGISR
jgi:hypothetical protein